MGGFFWSCLPNLLAGFQVTQLIATAGVTEAGVLWPLVKIRAPTSRPRSGVQLNSTAGAKPIPSLEPEFRSTDYPF